MTQKLTYPTPQARGTTSDTKRPRFSMADIVVVLGLLALIYLLVRLSAGVTTPYSQEKPLEISLAATNLPYYAARSLLRMFVALFFSFGFTFTYGYLAAKSRRLEKVLVPLLDILQSVPVLGFLSITVTGFVALFPGNVLGLECASVFAIFTSQAWNMAFSFYNSLKTLPKEMDEAVRSYRLSGWQRFWKLEVPASMIGLMWNGMMSFGGGWFFLVASETITVLTNNYILPGIGSYLGQAVKVQDFGALGWALVVMVIMVVGVDQLFWRPLVAWSEKFKLETSAGDESRQSWMLNLLRRSGLAAWAGLLRQQLGDRLIRLLRRDLSKTGTPIRPKVDKAFHLNPRRERLLDWWFFGGLVLLALIGCLGGLNFIGSEVDGAGLLEVVGLGLLTFARVVAMIVLASVIWVPVGVWIGFNPKVSRMLQPVVQILASFPANFLFPFATIFFLKTGFPIDFGAAFLMSLGAQWYVLFNTIAGAMAIPNDLREASRNFGVKGWQLWRSLILPGIFGAWVTGAITASGGAWNASIVSEVVSWGQDSLTAHGLGAYIAQYTTSGDWPRIVLGISVMSLFVVGLNRFFWARLYQLAATRYRLG